MLELKPNICGVERPYELLSLPR